MFAKIKTVPVPFAGNILDWGYVFERNVDDEIDYVAGNNLLLSGTRFESE